MQKLKLITRQQGFTIVEALISLALVAMLTLAIFGALSVMRRSYDRNTKNNYNLLAAKSGLSQIADVLRYADGITITNSGPDSGHAAAVTVTNPTTAIITTTTISLNSAGTGNSLQFVKTIGTTPPTSSTKSIAEPLVNSLTFTKASDARIQVSMTVVDPSPAKITANPELNMSTTVRMLNVN
jgi:type II secretory pathway pseudopilin PulG